MSTKSSSPASSCSFARNSPPLIPVASWTSDGRLWNGRWGTLAVTLAPSRQDSQHSPSKIPAPDHLEQVLRLCRANSLSVLVIGYRPPCTATISLRGGCFGLSGVLYRPLVMATLQKASASTGFSRKAENIPMIPPKSPKQLSHDVTHFSFLLVFIESRRGRNKEIGSG